MPIRHDGDFQRKTIKSWDSWVDDAIREAQEQGDFDNLPDHGKPIKLEDQPFAPDMASALRTLKNAGYEPAWMELDRQITRGKEELQDFLDRSVRYLQARLDEVSRADSGPESAQPVSPPGMWARIWAWLTFGDDFVPESRPATLSIADLVTLRDRMRDQYLERAAAIDKMVTEFHAALPRNLWHLERMRLTPEAAAQTFDRARPPLT